MISSEKALSRHVSHIQHLIVSSRRMRKTTWFVELEMRIDAHPSLPFLAAVSAWAEYRFIMYKDFCYLKVFHVLHIQHLIVSSRRMRKTTWYEAMLCDHGRSAALPTPFHIVCLGTFEHPYFLELAFCTL